MIIEAGCGCDRAGQCSREDCDEPPGPRTGDVYRTDNIPMRFMYPKLLRGYREPDGSAPHPCYRSTSMDYGWFAPTVHTVPTTYYPRNYAFSVVAGRGGMWRNCSLNTDLDKPPR